MRQVRGVVVRRAGRVLVVIAGIIGFSGATYVALALFGPAVANAGPSLVCTYTDAAANQLMSAANNWSPSACGGSSDAAGTATLSGAQLVFPATIPSQPDAASPIDDESLSIDSIVFNNTYTMTTPVASGSETLTLTPSSSSTPPVGLSVTQGQSAVEQSGTSLTIDLGDAQEWAAAPAAPPAPFITLSVAVPIAGSSGLQLGDATNSGPLVLQSASPGDTGNTTIDSAQVTVQQPTALGSGPLTLTGTDPELNLDNTGTPFTFSDAFTMAALGGVEDENGNKLSSNVTVDSGTGLSLSDGSATDPFPVTGGTISGSGAAIFTSSNGGTVGLGDVDTVGPGGSFGACGLEAGTGPTQLASADAFPSGCTLVVESGATVDLDGHSLTAGSAASFVPGLGGAGTVTNNGGVPATLSDGGSTDTFGGTLQDGTSALALAVDTNGSLTLSGANTYSGGTTVHAGGILNAAGATTSDPLGASTGAVTVDNGGSLELRSAFASGTLDNALDLGNGTSGTATLNYEQGSGVAEWDGPMALDGSSDIGAAASETLLIEVAISGTGPLAVNGGGETGAVTFFPLSGFACSGNTDGGGTTVVAGSLTLRCPNAAAGNVTVDTGATLVVRLNASGYFVANDLTVDGTLADNTVGTVTMSGTIDFGSSGVIGGSNGLTFAFANVLSGNSVTVDAPGSTVEFDANNTYTGTTTVEGGTLATATGMALPDTPFVVDDAATVDLVGTAQTVSSVSGAGTVTSSSAGGLLAVNESVPDAFVGVISGAVDLQQAGPSVLELDGTAANTYSGGTTVVSGTLEASGDALDDPFGSGTVHVASGAALELGSAFSGGAITNELDLGDGTPGIVQFLDNEPTGAAQWSGPVVLDGPSEFGGNTGGNLEIDGVVSGTGPLTVGDATFNGDVTLNPQSAGACAANTYGATTVTDGVLVLRCPDGAGSTAADTITVDTGSILQLQLAISGDTVPNDFVLDGRIHEITPGALTMSGTGALGPAANLFTGGDATSITFPNALSSSGGTGSLTINGSTVSQGGQPFTTNLSGSDTYAGATTLDYGTLDVSGSIADSAVTVGAGTTLEGTGTVGGIASDTGTVIPGTPSSPGLLGVEGPTDLGPAGSAYDVTITGPSAGTGYPFIDSTSTVNLNDATLNVTDSAAVPYGTAFVIVLSSASGTPISGSFAGLAAGSRFTTAGGRILQVAYQSGAVVLTDVTNPPPSTPATPPRVTGYQLAGADGGVFAFGSAPYEGSLPGDGIHVSDIVGMAANAKGTGYFLVGADGGVFAFGTATYEGSLPGDGIQVDDIVGMRTTNDGKGYWLVGADGGVFAFGDAPYEGSLPGNGVDVHDIVAMREYNANGGYWLVGSDGGIFAFGSAPYEGSLPADGIHVDDIVSLVSSSDNQGYILAGADGGVFAFGDGAFEGSLPSDGVHVDDVVNIASEPSGQGYDLVGSDGGVFAFGDTPYEGSLPGDGVSVHDIVTIHDTIPIG